MPTYTYGSPVINQIANARRSRDNCADMIASGNASDLIVENEKRWDNTLDELIKDCLPSGSGFDAGTTFNEELSTDAKLVFDTQFHHMDDGGYTKWTAHRVTVRASFTSGLDIKVSGPNYRYIKDYIAETFAIALETAPYRHELPAHRVA
jgi:hypothetical protein